MNINEYKNSIKQKLKKVLSDEYIDSYLNAFNGAYDEIINIVNKDKNILDVGCGGGLLVDYLNISGYEVEGFDNYLYDSKTRAINEIINSKGLVINSDIKNYKFKKKYDIIFLSNVIEHLNEWQQNLDIIIKYLNPSGKIILILPNYNVPVEPHFMLPILYNKRITHKIFKNSIINYEKEHEKNGLWDSLNFIKPLDIKKYFEKKNFEIKNDKEYFARLIVALTNNSLNKDINFKRKINLMHKLLISLSKIFIFLKLFNLFKFLPIFCHPFIKIIAYKKQNS
jgi:2-polyprenyl-3-methyl-5-hydroxy-6-metoxy-1,4-benzoquinol methylase